MFRIWNTLSAVTFETLMQSTSLYIFFWKEMSQRIHFLHQILFFWHFLKQNDFLVKFDAKNGLFD